MKKAQRSIVFDVFEAICQAYAELPQTYINIVLSMVDYNNELKAGEIFFSKER